MNCNICYDELYKLFRNISPDTSDIILTPKMIETSKKFINALGLDKCEIDTSNLLTHVKMVMKVVINKKNSISRGGMLQRRRVTTRLPITKALAIREDNAETRFHRRITAEEEMQRKKIKRDAIFYIFVSSFILVASIYIFINAWALILKLALTINKGTDNSGVNEIFTELNNLMENTETKIPDDASLLTKLSTPLINAIANLAGLHGIPTSDQVFEAANNLIQKVLFKGGSEFNKILSSCGWVLEPLRQDFENEFSYRAALAAVNMRNMISGAGPLSCAASAGSATLSLAVSTINANAIIASSQIIGLTSSIYNNLKYACILFTIGSSRLVKSIKTLYGEDPILLIYREEQELMIRDMNKEEEEEEENDAASGVRVRKNKSTKKNKTKKYKSTRRNLKKRR